MYFLDFEDFEIAGASPEALVTVRGREARQRPIAGTRPRAATAEEDLHVAEDLLADEKERAEHVMLVDLGRNDLGRVCEYGSVVVDELMVVETYSHVMHIVSSVTGTLREGVSAMDALRASLPAGTLSGAPKIRAMQIIDELEPVKRGPYGGAIGYLSYTGDLDTCIYIRSAAVKDGRVHVQAGGGIVADSEAGYEERETEAKARRRVARYRAGLRADGLGREAPLVGDGAVLADELRSSCVRRATSSSVKWQLVVGVGDAAAGRAGSSAASGSVSVMSLGVGMPDRRGARLEEAVGVVDIGQVGVAGEEERRAADTCGRCGRAAGRARPRSRRPSCRRARWPQQEERARRADDLERRPRARRACEAASARWRAPSSVLAGAVRAAPGRSCAAAGRAPRPRPRPAGKR